MASNKLTNPMIMEALQMLMEDGLPGFRPVIEMMRNELMKLEGSSVLQAERYERCDQRQGYTNGFKNKTLQTRMGPIHLEVPKARGVALRVARRAAEPKKHKEQRIRRKNLKFYRLNVA